MPFNKRKASTELYSSNGTHDAKVMRHPHQYQPWSHQQPHSNPPEGVPPQQLCTPMIQPLPTLSRTSNNSVLFSEMRHFKTGHYTDYNRPRSGSLPEPS